MYGKTICLWAFSYVRRDRMRKSVDFFGGLKSAFCSRWGVFVDVSDIIRHYPASRRDTFHRFLLMCERCIYSLLHPNIDSSILKAVLIPVQ